MGREAVEVIKELDAMDGLTSIFGDEYSMELVRLDGIVEVQAAYISWI